MGTITYTYFDKFKMTIGTIISVSILIAFCSFLNASMDITYHNFKKSVYSKIAPPGTGIYKYFSSNWKNKWETDDNGNLIYDKDGNKIPKYLFDIHLPLFNHPLFFDSWHLFKTIMIGSLVIAIMVMYFKRQRIIFYSRNLKYWAVAIGVFLWFGLVWNLVFNLFYDSLLRL